MNKPGFIIVGAAKSGTTSLFEYLRSHPGIFLPPGKEIGYFADDVKNNKGLKSLDDYLKFFSSASSTQICGDVSTIYLFSKTAASNICAQLGPDTKIIIILRNPIDMIYSLWKHNIRDGGEQLSLAEAINSVPKRMSDREFQMKVQGSYVNYDYISRASYYDQVNRYINVFGRDLVKIYIFEHFFNDINSSLKDLFKFIGVNPEHRLDDYKIYNQAGTVHSKFLHNLYTRKSLFSNIVKIFMPPKIRASIRMWIYKKNIKPTPYPPMDEKLVERLKSLLSEDVRNLEKLTGINLERVWF